MQGSTTNVSNGQTHVWEWFIVGHARQSQVRQDRAMRRFVSARQDNKGVPWFWKNTVRFSNLIVVWLIPCSKQSSNTGRTTEYELSTFLL